jgi:hypothetical protein
VCVCVSGNLYLYHRLPNTTSSYKQEKNIL